MSLLSQTHKALCSFQLLERRSLEFGFVPLTHLAMTDVDGKPRSPSKNARMAQTSITCINWLFHQPAQSDTVWATSLHVRLASCGIQTVQDVLVRPYVCFCDDIERPWSALLHGKKPQTGSGCQGVSLLNGLNLLWAIEGQYPKIGDFKKWKFSFFWQKIIACG